MSSRLIPPNTGAIAITVAHDLVDVLGRQADGPRVDAAELLEQHRLALHHGQRAFGADVAEPEHRGPVADDGDGVLLDRQRPDLRGIRSDRRRDARDARRVGHREVVARLERRFAASPRACRRDGARNVRSETCSTSIPFTARTASRIRSTCVASAARNVTSRTLWPCPTRTRSIAPRRPPASPIAVGERRERAGLVLEAHAHRGAERRRGVHCGAPVVDDVRAQCDIVPCGFPILRSPT